jgi:DNA-binding beta-propeller fold protein YncE
MSSFRPPTIVVSAIAFAALIVSCAESAQHARSTEPRAARAGGGVVRGPASLDFDPTGTGAPASVLWDDDTSTLYIADNRNNQLWSWDDRTGFSKLAILPDDPAATAKGQTNLGQIARLPDGTLAVPRFGFGQRGAIVYVNPKTGAKGIVPGAALDRRRIGLARRSEGADAMWGTYFAQTSGSEPVGAVTKVSLGTEVDYATGFQKPVSVIVHDGALVVSDQGRGVLYTLPLEGAQPPYRVYASLPSPDTLTEGPNGSLITGQFKPLADGGAPQLRQVFADGGVSVLHPEAQLARPLGVAYDAKNRRVFVADSNGTTIRTIKILPID